MRTSKPRRGRPPGRTAATLELLRATRGILEEIQPATVRAVCYRLFAAGLIRDMGRNAVQSVGRMLTSAREDALIPWQWIVDETRAVETVAQWSNPDAIIRAAVRRYRRDYWQDQPQRVEVWSEKGTVRGTLAPVLQEYGVAFRVMHGYASATAVNDIAELSTDSDKPMTALYVGDWDPSGKHMSDVDLPGRIARYGGELDIVRVALVASDLAALPSFDPKTKRQDPRYGWFSKTVRTPCYELDAMPPPELRRRVEQRIRSRLNLALWEHARMIERAEMESLQAFHAAWKAA
jgi:hypothetical protein